MSKKTLKKPQLWSLKHFDAVLGPETATDSFPRPFFFFLALSKVLKQENKALSTTCIPLEETTFIVLLQGGLVTSGHLLNAESYLLISGHCFCLSSTLQLLWQVTHPSLIWWSDSVLKLSWWRAERGPYGGIWD